jgi:hypothetical protein
VLDWLVGGKPQEGQVQTRQKRQSAALWAMGGKQTTDPTDQLAKKKKTNWQVISIDGFFSHLPACMHIVVLHCGRSSSPK